MTTRTTDDDARTEIFDVSNWLDRAAVNRAPSDSEYVPRHRAEAPGDTP
jgi:hypothetical protein